MSKTCKLNSNYLDIIDLNNEKQIYFLGFVFADGNINKYGYAIHIEIQEEDKHILEEFQSILKHKSKILFRIKTKKHYKNKCRLNLYSAKLNQRFKELGCPSAKSLILKWPSYIPLIVDNKGTQSFIRGYFDGDGGIIRDNSTNSWKIEIVGTQDICEKIQIISNQLKISSRIVKDKRITNNVTRSFIITGNQQTRRFLDWLYKDSSIHLLRKYNRYLQILEYFKTSKRPYVYDNNFINKILSIKLDYKNGISIKEISIKYNMNRNTVTGIIYEYNHRNIK
jgi:hypothetical protein